MYTQLQSINLGICYFQMVSPLWYHGHFRNILFCEMAFASKKGNIGKEGGGDKKRIALAFPVVTDIIWEF